MTNEVNFKPAFSSANFDSASTHSRVDSGSLHSIQSVDPKSFFDVGFDSPPSPSMREPTATSFDFASFDFASFDPFAGTRDHTAFSASDMHHSPSQSNHEDNAWATFPSESSGVDAQAVQAQDNSSNAFIDWGDSGNAIDTLLDESPLDDSQSSHGTSSVADQYAWAATSHGLHYNERVFGPLNNSDFFAFANAFSGRSSSNIQSTEIHFTARAPGFENSLDESTDAFSVKNNSVEDLVGEWYDYFASQSTEGATPYKIFNFSQSSAEDLPQELVDAFQNGDAVKWVVNDSGDLVVGFGQGGGDELKHSLLATHVVGMDSWSPQERYEFVVNRPLSDDSSSVVAHSENAQSENTKNSHLRNRSAFAAGELNLVFTQETSGKQLGWLSYDNGSGHFQPEASSVWDGAVRTKINAFVQNALLPKLANVDKINVGFNPDALK